MKISVNIKSGTGSYVGDSDLIVAELRATFIPRIGEKLNILKSEDSPITKTYLVTDIVYFHNIPKESITWSYEESITIYVVPTSIL